MTSRPELTETVRPVDRVNETGQPNPTTNPLREQYVAELFGNGNGYDFHQGGSDRTQPPARTGDRNQPGSSGYDYHQGPTDRVGPPAPERTGDRNTFETVRNARGEVDAINFGDGTTMRRTGPKEWQVMRGDQPLNAQELQAFAGSNALGFPLCAKDGKILGNITQKTAGGDIQYDARNTELNIYVTRKTDGSRDLRNYNDYSRTKIGTDGREQDKDYWDGYQWRHGNATKLPSGQVQITFNPNEPQPPGSKAWPRTVVRDAGSDALTVQHNDQLVMHANWREQKLTTRRGGQPEDVKYYDGENWRHGREQVMPGSRGGPAAQRRIEFTDGTGPQSVLVDTSNGEIKEKTGRMSEPTQEEREQQERQRERQRELDRVNEERRRQQARPQPRPYVSPQPYCVPNGGRRS
ncbi:MAG: hypothetical protein K2W95_10780 [Candidatus Obscuribacterales bacterium]|nr:hypothetical protein [Candidatus Obscuribacterales bacterium]